MLLTLFIYALAIPLSYFQSEKSTEWKPPKLSYFDGDYRHEYPQVSFPIIPIWPFGLRFDLDLMIALADDDPWGMIEVAYIQTKEGEKVWFTLDSRLDGRQYIGLSDTSFSDQISSLFPLPSYDAQLVVKETKDAYKVSYKRGHEPIAFSMPRVQGSHPPSNRNGHAMNHAQRDLMAILNISSLKLQAVDWMNSPHKTQSILWQPISGLMSQTVSGLRRGEWIQNDSEVHHQGSLLQNGESDICVQTERSQYCFAKYHEQLQLHTVSLYQPLHGEQVSSLVFSPALPDLRFIPKEAHCSQAYWNIEGQEHLQGTICIHPLEYGSSMVVSFVAEEPSWVAARPVLSMVTIEKKSNHVSAHSIVLSAGSQYEHQLPASISMPRSISIPKKFEWNGSTLSSSGTQGEEEGIAYSVLVPLVPKEGALVGRVQVDASLVQPFLLGMRMHHLPSIQGMEFQVDYENEKSVITLRLRSKEKVMFGGWVEVELGSLSTAKSAQSMFIRGHGEGGGIMEPQARYFLSSFQIDSSRVLTEFTLPIFPTISQLPKGVMVEKSLFWVD